MQYATFDKVSQLDTAIQKKVLREGDAVERVLAAWALGITLGASSSPDLLASLHESPAPGTRRNLLVILAGLGERDALRVFAQDDPDDYVRATACQYLIRTSVNEAFQFINERLLLDKSAIVRQAILSESSMDPSAFRIDYLTQLLADEADEVRELVVSRLLTIKPLNQLFPGILEDRIPLEANGQIRHRLLTLCLQADGSHRLIRLAATLPREYTLEILQVLVEAHIQIDWQHLFPVSHADDPVYDNFLIKMLPPAETIHALPWLLRGIARANNLTFAYSAQQLLIEALPQLQNNEQLQLDPLLVTEVVSYLRHVIDALEDEEYADDVVYEQERNDLRQLIDVLEAQA